MNSSSSAAAPLGSMPAFLPSPSISLGIMIWPLRSNWNATEPEVPRLPPACVNALRTSAAVRLRLSVRASQYTAMPAGP